MYTRTAIPAYRQAMDRAVSSASRQPVQRLTRVGLVLLVLAALAWATTYGPPGTLTSVALGAMAAYALAAVGSVLLVTALFLRARR
jgi:hypothetical protein